MSSHIFRIFKPDESKEDRVQRRRDQLRDAQKNYRDRKTRYTRSLEQELSRLRVSEASLLREVGRLRSTVQNLTRTMRHNGLDVLDDSDATSPPGSLGYVGSPLGYAGIDDVMGSVTSGSVSEAGTHSDQLSPGFFSSALGPRGPRPSPPQHSRSPESPAATTDVCLGGWDSGVEVASPGVRVCDVDPVGAGMDFVLTIERPCLGHIHGDPSKPDDPDGHALTVSSHMLCVSGGGAPAARQQQQPPPPPPPGTVCRDVPSAVLESLLSLSSELAAEHEVTPIQAWNSIRRRPQFGGLEVRSLGRLAKSLRDAVKCHGFGAVIDRRVFDKLVSQFLFDGSPF
ncbi:hypothetical protein RB595_004389 [Gaeumannomyces hyphopodioides]